MRARARVCARVRVSVYARALHFLDEAGDAERGRHEDERRLLRAGKHQQLCARAIEAVSTHMLFAAGCSGQAAVRARVWTCV